MLFDDTYKTISSASEGIFRDKGSKFLAFAYPIRTESDAKELIKVLKSEHPKANHHCWALRLTPDQTVYKVNDDGEPSGSAGRPILNSLLSAGLTNILVVVVRYFGGTLLGIPGLINAYKTATVEALNAAKIIEKTLNDVYKIEFNYDGMNDVMKICKDENLPVINPVYNNQCSIETEIRKSHLNSILPKFEKLTGTKLKFISTN